MACLATRRGARTGCVRPTSASHYLTYEYPRLVSSRLLFEACASPMATSLHSGPGDRWTWRFTMPDPLRRTSSSWRSVFSPVRSRSSRTSDTPVAPVSPRLELALQPFDPVCQDRLPRPSVKMRRFVRSEVPSVTGGHSYACTSRHRSVCGHVRVSATVRPSAPFHPRFRMHRFRDTEVTAR